MISAVVVFSINNTGELNFDEAKAAILGGGAQFVRWAFADASVTGLLFPDAKRLAGNHIIYVYFGDKSLTPFHEESEVQQMASGF